MAIWLSYPAVLSGLSDTCIHRPIGCTPVSRWHTSPRMEQFQHVMVMVVCLLIEINSIFLQHIEAADVIVYDSVYDHINTHMRLLMTYLLKAKHSPIKCAIETSKRKVRIADSSPLQQLHHFALANVRTKYATSNL